MVSETLALTWYDAIFDRHSTRNYDGRPVPDGLLDALAPLLSGFAPLCEGARAVIVADSASEVFTGLVGTVDETSRFRINGRNGGLIIDEDIIQLKDCWKRTFGGLI